MTILNHRDYRTARTRISQLTQAVSVTGLIGDIAEHLPPDVSKVRQETLKVELARLQSQVSEYESLLEKSASQDHSIDVDNLGSLAILARISRGLSQRELAELLDIKEQQIQRYESERYAGISLARYQRVLDILGVELHPKLGPSDPKSAAAGEVPKFEISPELLREVRKRNWIDLHGETDRSETQREVANFVEQSLKAIGGRPLFRRPIHTKHATDDNAVRMWQARIAQVAQRSRSGLKGKFNLADTAWLKRLIALSIFPDGPARAVDMAREKGIQVVIEPVLPGASLDGAALRLTEGMPVIGLSLRYDRVDNFWFTFLHELGHIFLHYNLGLSEGFFDDLDVESDSAAENEADSFARSQLIPDEMWNSSPARFAKSDEVVHGFARALGIHPAIVAGRIRRERGNFRLFDNLLGRNEVTRLFAGQSS
jgi:HTH-type transcriptional regulator/antitoxin HigA